MTMVRRWHNIPVGPILTRTLENSQLRSDDPEGAVRDWLRTQVDSAGEVARTGSSSSTPVGFPSDFIGSGVLPSSDRLSMEGAIGISGERGSRGSPFNTVSGESRQAEILSGSGGHVVRAAIAAAIELLLGVGIAN